MSGGWTPSLHLFSHTGGKLIWDGIRDGPAAHDLDAGAARLGEQVRGHGGPQVDDQIEKPLVFAGNDRPGVMLAGAARSFLNRYGVRVGERAGAPSGTVARWSVSRWHNPRKFWW
jgi:NADPH-dependent 2,4-dienoyl-CoA reductase/sulfur reductase-like enzyme